MTQDTRCSSFEGSDEFMPPSCRRLSKDEAELMRLLAVARRREPGELEAVVGQLVGIEQESAATQAVNALAFC